DETVLGKNPKIFIGYSDLTALHLYLYRRFGWVTFHGPMAAKDLAEGEEHYDRESMLKAIASLAPIGEIKSSRTEMLHRGDGGNIGGGPVGGGINVFKAMARTPGEVDTRRANFLLQRNRRG